MRYGRVDVSIKSLVFYFEVGYFFAVSIIVVVGKIPLNFPCRANEDVCADNKADCIASRCFCTASFFEKNGKCGKDPGSLRRYRPFRLRI
jgi:hypothetical protein